MNSLGVGPGSCLRKEKLRRKRQSLLAPSGHEQNAEAPVHDQFRAKAGRKVWITVYSWGTGQQSEKKKKTKSQERVAAAITLSGSIKRSYSGSDKG